MRGPVYLCREGHIISERARERGTCPQCNRNREKRRMRAVDNAYKAKRTATPAQSSAEQSPARETNDMERR